MASEYARLEAANNARSEIAFLKDKTGGDLREAKAQLRRAKEVKQDMMKEAMGRSKKTLESASRKLARTPTPPAKSNVRKKSEVSRSKVLE